MKSKLLAILLFVGSSAIASARVFVGVGVGFGGPGCYAPPPPYVRYAPVPRYPGAGYSWVGGYRYPAASRYAWRDGYWSRPPYTGAYWVSPRYYGRRYYRGYWRR